MSFLLENHSNTYSQFTQDYENTFNENPPSVKKVLGMMNRKALGSNIDPKDEFIYSWMTKKGLMRKQGNVIAPTPSGSSFRQTLATSGDSRGGKSDLRKAYDGGFKDIRRYFQDVTDESTLKFLQTQDDATLEAIKQAREFDQEDIAIIKGIRERVQNHKERFSFIQAMQDKNPERLDKLITMGLIDPKTYALNTQVWDDFTGKINKLDPAMIKALIPKYYEWATHSTGNTARNVNQFVLAIHPESRSQTTTGRSVWELLSNMDEGVYQSLKRGKKPQQGDYTPAQYDLLIKAVAAIVRAFPDANSKEDLMSRIDQEFKSRVDFKSLDRSADKTHARRDAVKKSFD